MIVIRRLCCCLLSKRRVIDHEKSRTQAEPKSSSAQAAAASQRSSRASKTKAKPQSQNADRIQTRFFFVPVHAGLKVLGSRSPARARSVSLSLCRLLLSLSRSACLSAVAAMINDAFLLWFVLNVGNQIQQQPPQQQQQQQPLRLSRSHSRRRRRRRRWASTPCVLSRNSYFWRCLLPINLAAIWQLFNVLIINDDYSHLLVCSCLDPALFLFM